MIRYYRDYSGKIVPETLWDEYLTPNHRAEIGAEQCKLLKQIQAHPSFRNHFGNFKIKLVPLRCYEDQPWNHPEIEWCFGIKFKRLTACELETLAQFRSSPASR